MGAAATTPRQHYPLSLRLLIGACIGVALPITVVATVLIASEPPSVDMGLATRSSPASPR